MYLSNADGVCITDPRTLRKVYHCNFCAFEYLYGAFPAVFLHYELTLGRLPIVAKILSVLIQVVQYFAEIIAQSWLQRFRHLRTIFGWHLVFVAAWWMNEIIPIQLIAMGRISSCVVPLVDVKTVSLLYKFEGCLYELASACCSAGQKISTFLEQNLYLASWGILWVNE